MMFQVDRTLTARARTALASHRNLYWVIGPAAAGKSTITRALAERYGLTRYDMDEHSFGLYSYDQLRHPATWAWFHNENPLDFMLSLPPAQFDALYRAANAEMLDLLADDVAELPEDQPLLIDGGVTHPSVIVQAFPASHMVCIDADDATRVAAWTHDPARQEMRRWVDLLPDPAAKWARFLAADCELAATLRRESSEEKITIVQRSEETTVDKLVAAIAAALGIAGVC